MSGQNIKLLLLRYLTHDELPAATPALFFEFVDDRGGTDVQDTGGVANLAGIHGHVDDLLLHPRRLPDIGVVQQKRMPAAESTLSAAVALLAS
jgi:hypothetical protein